MLNMIDQEIVAALESYNYSLVENIGSGGYASCFKVFSNYYKQYFACKVINNKEKTKELGTKTYNAELEALIHVNHPNIIHIYQTFSSPNYLFLILEYCPNGDLCDYVRKYGPLRSEQLIRYTKNLVEALNFLEQRKLSHNDIKPSNILIDSYQRIKLADFGLSKKLLKDDELCDEYVGSVAFIAPELFKRQPYHPIKADVWSLGVTLYYLATGEFPFDCNSFTAVKEFLKSGEYFMPLCVHPIIRELISKCIVLDPSKRISYSEMLQMLIKYQTKQSKKLLPTLSLKAASSYTPTGKISIPKFKPTRLGLRSGTVVLKSSSNIKV